ncbi:MAG: ribosomal protein S5, partial [Dehalococcoidia bacterium]
VGVGMGKAHEVPEAIRKGANIARRSIIRVPLVGSTVPHPIRARFSASYVLIKPVPPGVGLKAGGSARAVLEMAGVRDVSAKSLGSSNPVNLVKATVLALSHLQDPHEVREQRQPEAATR